VLRVLFPDCTTHAEIRPHFVRLHEVPRHAFAKIVKAWTLPEDQYQRLLVDDSWYRALAVRYPDRTEAALMEIKLQLVRRPAYKSGTISNKWIKRREQATILSRIGSVEWKGLGVIVQRVLLCYYGVDLPDGQWRTVADIAEECGMTTNEVLDCLHKGRLTLRL